MKIREETEKLETMKLQKMKFLFIKVGGLYGKIMITTMKVAIAGRIIIIFSFLSIIMII